MSVGLGLGSVFARLFRYSILCVFFSFSLDCFVLVLFAFWATVTMGAFFPCVVAVTLLMMESRAEPR